MKNLEYTATMKTGKQFKVTVKVEKSGINAYIKDQPVMLIMMNESPAVLMNDRVTLKLLNFKVKNFANIMIDRDYRKEIEELKADVEEKAMLLEPIGFEYYVGQELKRNAYFTYDENGITYDAIMKRHQRDKFLLNKISHDQIMEAANKHNVDDTSDSDYKSEFRFNLEQAKDLIAIAYAEKKEKEEKKEVERKELHKKFAQARETGAKVLIDTHQSPCRKNNHDCYSDNNQRWANPDGTITIVSHCSY